MFCCYATLTHMIPRLTDFGYTLVEASLVMSMCAGFGWWVKPSFGWLSDRFSVRKVMAVVIIAQFVVSSDVRITRLRHPCHRRVSIWFGVRRSADAWRRSG